MSDIEIDLYEKLNAEISVATWASLSPHAERGALFWVDATLPLVDAAIAVANDRVDLVQKWLSEGLLKRAEDSQPLDAPGYHFLITQPYVLATPLHIDEPSAPTE